MQILQEQISATAQPPDLLYRANSWPLWSYANSALRLSLVCPKGFAGQALRFLFVSSLFCRPWGALKSNKGPLGTMPLGLRVGWLR